MALKEQRYVCDIMDSMYERSLNDANDIIARAQNPLTALCLIFAVLIYMAQTVVDLRFPIIKLENVTIIGSFYLFLILTIFTVSQTIYFLWRGFKFGGYTYETIGLPHQIIDLTKLQSEQELFTYLLEKYQDVCNNNIKNNRARMEYIRLATERIIMAVAFCFLTSILFCIIIAFK